MNAFLIRQVSGLSARLLLKEVFNLRDETLGCGA
jgi:hypothetical protein